MDIYGLVGKRLSHSYSKTYFRDKFQKENIPAAYWNFEIPDISVFPEIIKQFPALKGLNVTIPYKTEVLPYIDEIDEEAASIGAVNCIKITRDKENRPYLKGHNTDSRAFRETLVGFLTPERIRKGMEALVLGTGGAAKAVCEALRKLGIKYTLVSRTPVEGKSIGYNDVTEDILDQCGLIVNATPSGMAGREDEAPDIPYRFITPGHFCYDLTYNPPVTRFLQLCGDQGAKTKNGLDMLHRQADISWDIWTDK